MVAVSAYMGGTRSSGVLSSAGDVLEMRVVRGGVCDMCMSRDGVGGVGGEWMGFGLYQSWRNRGKVGSVFWLRWCGWCLGGEWVGGLCQGGWGGVKSICCESGLFVLMAGPGICILC